MKAAGHVRWLSSELPKLVAQGVLQPDVADQLKRHYGDPTSSEEVSIRWLIVLFSVLGAVLIGGGLILLLAHNWDEIPRSVRAAISISPLAITAALGAWLLWTERNSTAWSEGVGAAQTLAIGTAIALVSQTYHLGGRLDEFVLTWALLALPIAYLLPATFPALFYLVGIAFWAGWNEASNNNSLWYFPLLAAVLPLFLWQVKLNRYHPRPVLIAWVLAVTAIFGSIDALQDALWAFGNWPVMISVALALVYLIGTCWWNDASSTWQKPFQTVGGLGLVGLALLLSFDFPWNEVRWRPPKLINVGWQFGISAAIGALMCLCLLVLWISAWKRRVWHEILLGGIPLYAAVGWWFAAVYDFSAVGAAIFNLYLLALGLVTLLMGFRERQLGTVNAGMAILAATILFRFFDSDLGFVVRGVAFIIVGIGFLLANLAVMRWKGATV